MAFQLIGGPDWIRRDRFSVDATAGAKVSTEQIRIMVRSLLVDRFGLVTRRERQEMPHTALVMARDGRPGPGLVRCDDPEKPLPFKPLLVKPGGIPMAGTCRSIASIAAGLSATLGTPIVDTTGLTGLWNFQLVFAFGAGPGRNDSGPALDNAVPLPVALQEQLGLKLESVTGPLDVLLVESVKPPTED